MPALDIKTGPDGLKVLPVLDGDARPDVQAAPPGISQAFVTGVYSTVMGPVPKVDAKLTGADRWGAVKARWGAGRMEYKIDPGLYALGYPDEQSNIFVSANYKMSFDVLRAALYGRNAWLLVLDTKGINVWCAAGKGTFGTQELIWRIETSGVKNAAPRGKLIVPQLGAPGIAAHVVQKKTGYRVHYGPVRADDLPAYLDAGLVASASMRKVSFSLKDRVVLIPMELVAIMKPFLLAAAFFALFASLARYAGQDASGLRVFLTIGISDGLFAFGALGGAVIAGAVLHPILLPFFPVRAFSLQGAMIGGIVALALVFARGADHTTWSGLLETAAWLLIIPSIAAFLAMNFTGSSTYTSLSGVKKEMGVALPAEIATAALGGVVWLGSLLTAWGGL